MRGKGVRSAEDSPISLRPGLLPAESFPIRASNPPPVPAGRALAQGDSRLPLFIERHHNLVGHSWQTHLCVALQYHT